MKILILCGSPHKNGNTNALAEAFVNGVDQKMHQIKKIWIPGKRIAPCTGCLYCQHHDGVCIFQDDMVPILAEIYQADLLVFVTPIYYFGMTAQLKAVIDRMSAIDDKLKQQEKKAILLTAGGLSDDWIMDGIKTQYHIMLKYLNWQSVGAVYAFGCNVTPGIKDTKYLLEAEDLGRLVCG